MQARRNGRGRGPAARVGALAMAIVFSSAGWHGVRAQQGAETLEAVVKEAARTLKEGPPKKLKTRGKPKVVRWEELDAALARIPAQVDYPHLVARLRDLLSKDTGFAPDREVLGELIDKTLAQEEVLYGALFALDDADLMPITNTVLKYLPDEAWTQVPVYNKKGERIGNFEGKFPHEKSGGLLANKSYRIFYFQYRDPNGASQTAATSDYLQRDEFCVRWGDVKNRPALTLASIKPQ